MVRRDGNYDRGIWIVKGKESRWGKERIIKGVNGLKRWWNER